MKMKVCGMNLNTLEVASLQPDYLGFIFWKPSKRFFDTSIPEIDPGIDKVGVFVDASVEEVIQKVIHYQLDAVQLHGKESPAYCKVLSETLQESRPDIAHLKQAACKIIKVFSVKDHFNFEALQPYEDVCDFYLFDTKGRLPGGNGFAFDWSLLKDYPMDKPYFLSGGIGIEEIDSIKKFRQTPAFRCCHAIDVNSKFEIEPGRKDIANLKRFKAEIIDI